MNEKIKIAVVGLGYVGLPVALGFGQKWSVVGYDINKTRIESLLSHVDSTGEMHSPTLQQSNVHFTSNAEDIRDANTYIITVPTPIDHAKQPDLSALISASKTIGRYLKKQDIVIYESTVYPGATEEVCKPILELESGLKVGEDFHIGYSPERINPGDKQHTFENIVKVISGDCKIAEEKIAMLYESVVKAGVHRAPSIQVAEMAKIIENTQRDINIALMNELAMICNRLNISSKAVLDAAKTKWNFLDFKPGLVGGHCIGVDPYYLTYKAQQLGHHPEVILAGRRINDNMGAYIAEQTILKMIKAGSSISNRKVAILGFTFKENCSDIRNTKVIDIIHTLEKYNVAIQIHAPHANPEAVQAFYGYELSEWDEIKEVDAMIIAVEHNRFKEIETSQFIDKLSPTGVIIDIKNMFDNIESEKVWSI